MLKTPRHRGVFSFGFTVVNAIAMRCPSDTNSPRIDRTLSELFTMARSSERERRQTEGRRPPAAGDLLSE